MALVTEFRPASHEFYPEVFHGAAFIGAKAADALWFYRFDASFIEVRDAFTCQSNVFASLSTTEIKQRFRNLFKGDEIRIVNVQDAYVGEFHTLICVVRDVQEDKDHVFIWNLLTLHLQLLISAPRLLTAATVTPQQAIMVSHRLVKSWGPSQLLHRPLISKNGSSFRSSSMSMPSSPQKGSMHGGSAASMDLEEEVEDEHEHGHEEQDYSHRQVHIQGNRRQLLVLGHHQGWVTIYKFTVSLTGHVTCSQEPTHEICLKNGAITAFATLPSKHAGSVPVIVAGTSESRVFVIKYDAPEDGRKLEVLMAPEDLRSKKLPITSITLETTNHDGLDLLAVGQGYLPGAPECGECPTISIYYLRVQRCEYRLLGYVQPPMGEGETATGGKTLAATVSEDDRGLRIHCAFSIQVDQAPLRSNLTTVQINDKEVQNLDVVEMTAVEGGTLLDISPQTNTYELSVLYLNKLVTYVHAADMASNDRESEWATEGGKKTQHDMTPAYGSFFPDDRFKYTVEERAEIEERRQKMGGRLFYDRLLEFVDLEVGVLYPPQDHRKQQNLWTNLHFNGTLRSDNRNCLAYYLLKDQSGDMSQQFLNKYKIPKSFVDLMDGFWALDHFQFKNAVLYLSRPGLTVDWIEDVIEVIYEHGSPQLARQFIVASNLKPSSERFVDLNMNILLRTDLIEAFYYQRSATVTTATAQQPNSDDTGKDGDEDMQEVCTPTERSERLFTTLLDYCFLDKPNRKAIKAMSLLTMTETEENRFVRYCEKHSGLTREIGQEYLIMYFVNHSRYAEAVQMHRKLLAVELEKEDAEQFHHEALERRNSATAKGTQQQAMSKSQKRKVLIENLLMLLPEPQRRILNLEQEQKRKPETVPATMYQSLAAFKTNVNEDA
ncbi:hypothetical protein BGZ51_002847 [Haplosporangium sp. Z 767]|nr:hypothetical protein BGZ51_002847 [Haplosporangium sp. Z 767]KAF9196242.1 hypothetical protein BGZ50_001318 [Haplosporangium sp. Z 11]